MICVACRGNALQLLCRSAQTSSICSWHQWPVPAEYNYTAAMSVPTQGVHCCHSPGCWWKKNGLWCMGGCSLRALTDFLQLATCQHHDLQNGNTWIIVSSKPLWLQVLLGHWDVTTLGCTFPVKQENILPLTQFLPLLLPPHHSRPGDSGGGVWCS